MKLIILNDYDQVSEWTAKYIRNRIRKFNPGPDRFFTLGLPTGRRLKKISLYNAHSIEMQAYSDCVCIAGGTPLGCYKKLIEYHKKGEISFQYVKTFNMDEYVGM